MKKIIAQYGGWLIVATCSLVPLALQADDKTVSGNLTVTGTGDLWDNNLSLGTHTGTPELASVTLSFADGTSTAFNFNATSSANIWQWQQNAGTALQSQMTLDNNDTLSLYNHCATPTAKVVLNPTGTSSFAKSVTFNGNDNEMPHQALVNANSVLTMSLADSRYASVSENLELSWGGDDSNSALTWGMANDLYFSFGDIWPDLEYGNGGFGERLTQGDGDWEFMPNTSSIALEYSTATGSNSTASGYSTATGNYSTALGSSIASGSYSTVMGNSTASGDYSTAMGYATTAASFASVTMGLYTSGISTSSASTDPLLEVGAGGSDAFIVFKNGNAAFQGSVSMAPSPDIPMFTGN